MHTFPLAALSLWWWLLEWVLSAFLAQFEVFPGLRSRFLPPPIPQWIRNQLGLSSSGVYLRLLFNDAEKMSPHSIRRRGECKQSKLLEWQTFDFKIFSVALRAAKYFKLIQYSKHSGDECRLKRVALTSISSWSWKLDRSNEFWRRCSWQTITAQ